MKSPRAFDFFQLLQLIERVDPRQTPLGEQGPAANEAVRIRPSVSLGFPLADLDSAEWAEATDAAQARLYLNTTFLGLYGSDSPLPTHFTESLLPDTDEDRVVRSFLDLFHHRVFSLLYRVWKKYRYYITFRPDGNDPISRVVRGFLGIGTPRAAESLEIRPVRLFRYVGLLSQRPRSTVGLIGLLSDFFEGVPADVEQCVGRWLPIQLGDCNRLGGRKCSLGADFLLGERLFDRSGKFRVKLGPVGFEQYVRFLPPGDAAAELREIVHFYCDDPLEFDVEVTLRGDDVPDTPLGEQGMLGRLSWTSWLKSAPAEDQSVIFRLQSEEH
ncbi:MAG: type VI secretion system baseplate subunit TssG [Planctomycetes bacterium]|nr:type VI secretion system baseplate subunit TssG [Planctomycetota bacterium]